MVRYIAGEVQVSPQLLSNERPGGQLRFDSDPLFEPSSLVKAFDLAFRREIEFMRQDMNRPSLLFGPSHPRHETQKLFAPTATCRQYLDVGDSCLTCHLDEGHSGTHYDAHARVEWRSR